VLQFGFLSNPFLATKDVLVFRQDVGKPIYSIWRCTHKLFWKSRFPDPPRLHLPHQELLLELLYIEFIPPQRLVNQIPI
jgi:hypothetical protein